MSSKRIEAVVELCLLVFLFFFFILLVLRGSDESVKALNRTLFPSSFIFGVGSSAYQLEGAANIDGRGPSIWDTFTKEHSEKILDHSSGAVAEDFYRRYKCDIKQMKKIGFDSFRFSISWSRIFPKGKGTVNYMGVKFYNDLINELLSNGLIPFVTLFHFDLPQALEDEYSGFLSPKIVGDFHEYADFCFKTFGDRVKHWVTLNEPYGYSHHGYNTGSFPPGRCSDYVGNCTSGDSATEPYLIGHHLLLVHAAAVRLYKAKYQRYQNGEIGITLVTHWFEPKTNSLANRQAATRVLDFWLGWYADPITYGDYPKSMRSIVGDRLPKFTKSESEILKGSYDFLGINYYTANYAENAPVNSNVNRSFSSDMQATLSAWRNGVPIGPPTALDWLYIYPKGLHKLLLYLKHKYKDPLIYITENGVAEANDASKSVREAIRDVTRVSYYDRHLRYLLQAIKDGVKVKGYYAWSFFDDFEWDAGYTVRFGITFVDFKNILKRYFKYSAYWFKMFLLP